MEPNEDVRGVFLTDSKRTTQRSPRGSATGSVLEIQDGNPSNIEGRNMILPNLTD